MIYWKTKLLLIERETLSVEVFKQFTPEGCILVQ